LHLHPNIFTGENMNQVTFDENLVKRMIEEAVKQEREACAKVCDDLWEDDGTAYECAEAIRTLGQA
jgi:hypothetical protein